jgi:hypothetical protein
MISVERTTRNRHFLRGSNGAIGSTTTRTRTRETKGKLQERNIV